MSIIKSIPKDSCFIQPVNFFDAAFNVPAAGQYSFNIPANHGQVVFPITKTSVFLIDRYSFSCTLDEGVYLRSVSVLPVFRLRRQKDNLVIYKKAIPCVNYIDSAEAIVFYNSDNENDNLIADFEGVLNQVAETVGIASIRCQVTLNIYEIVNSDWIRDFRIRSKTANQIVSIYN
jgi:hypothetical protein